MANTSIKMKGPAKIIELDGIPSKNWKLEQNAVHLWNGKLWRKEPVGCVLCVEEEGSDHATLTHTDDNGVESFVCMEHGSLDEVRYSMRKRYSIMIGDVIRDGEEEFNDTILFPRIMAGMDRNELINRLLNEAEQAQIDSDVMSDDDD